MPLLSLQSVVHRMIWGVCLLLSAGFVYARPVSLTILHTTDLHGSIRRTPNTYAVHNDGSFLACATRVERIRAEAENVLLLDSGDIFQGTLDSQLSKGLIMARLMNAVGYDAWAIGNHEFDWGLPVLASFLDAMKTPALAANMLVGPEALPAFRQIQPFVMLTKDGLRIAVVGLTNPNIPMWTKGVRQGGLEFVDSRTALEHILPEVRKANPDILILLVHQGLAVRDDAANQVNEIGRNWAEFDVVLGGHLHFPLTGIRVGNVDYSQSGSGAQGLTRVDLTFDTVSRCVVDKKFTFLPITPDIPESPDLMALAAADLEKADKILQTNLGEAKNPIPSSTTPPGLSPVQQLICASVAAKVKAKVVIAGILSDEDLAQGPIRVADIWRIIPHENKISVMWLNVREIHDIMEESMQFWGADRYIGTWGLQYEVWPKAPAGERIRNIRDMNGRPIHPKTRLKVAVGSYHMAGAGGRFPTLLAISKRPNVRMELTNHDFRQAVIDYVRKTKRLSVSFGTNATIRTAPVSLNSGR